jgi:hypothetical protein
MYGPTATASPPGVMIALLASVPVITTWEPVVRK